MQIGERGFSARFRDRRIHAEYIPVNIRQREIMYVILLCIIVYFVQAGADDSVFAFSLTMRPAKTSISEEECGLEGFYSDMSKVTAS